MFCIAWFGRTLWLSALGRYLADTHGALSVADAVAIPAADYIRADVSIETLEQAARLVREGRVRRILMSCADAYGVSECEIAEKALRDKGYLEARIEWLRTEHLPDEAEADLVIRRLKDTDNKSAIILLPNYKERRLGRVYRRLGARNGIAVGIWGRRAEFDPERWWISQEGWKRFAEEFVRLTRLL